MREIPPSKNRKRSIQLFGLAACLVGMTSISCSKPRFQKVYPVTGQVFFEGQPAVGATVAFQPMTDPADPLVKPAGEVDQDGRFTLSTYSNKDGAPAGNYAVRIVWLPKGYVGPVERANKLPMRYGDAASSGLTAEVKKTNNEIPAFQLTK